MNEIIWLPTAERHITEIFNWLRERSETAAIKLFNDILDETERLRSFPEIGKKESLLKDYPKSFRSIVVRKNFKIIYFIERKNIFITAVWDCRKDPQTISQIYKND